MNLNFRAISIVLATAALVALTGAKRGDVKEYDGSDITSEDGIVIVRVIWDRTMVGSGGTKALTRDDVLYAVFKEGAGGKRKVVVEDIDKVRAIVMPAGRWYLAEIRTPRERNLPPIARAHQSFEVLGDHINYAGRYTIKFVRDASGEESPDVSVEFPPELVAEATEVWPKQFESKTLMYCPVGKKCKLPSEFRF